MTRLAICAMVRNEGPYLREWVTFHRGQGFSEFLLFDDRSSDGTKGILDGLGLQAIPLHGPDRPFLEQQARVLSAGALLTSADWLAAIDVDEFLFAKAPDRVAGILETVPRHVGQIAVLPRVFGSSGCILATEEPVLSRFTWRGDAEQSGRKLLVRPRAIRAFTSAHTVDLLPDYASAPAALHLNHYAVKSRQEFYQKMDRWQDRDSVRHTMAYWRSFDVNTFEDRELA